MSRRSSGATAVHGEYRWCHCGLPDFVNAKYSQVGFVICYIPLRCHQSILITTIHRLGFRVHLLYHTIIHDCQIAKILLDPNNNLDDEQLQRHSFF